MNLKKVSDGLHKLNTSQIIALGFAGVIFVGGLILWMPFLQCTRAGCYLPGCCFYSGNQCMCNRTFHSCYGVQWSPIGKIGHPVPDTDRRHWTDRSCKYDIYQLSAENFPEKPADHQRIL